jgi:hypothetical protein
MDKQKELMELERIYREIHRVCEINLYDYKSPNLEFSRKVVYASLTLFNYGFKLSKPHLFTNLPNITMEKIKEILLSIYQILTGIYFYDEKEQKIKELLIKHSLNPNELLTTK